VPSAPAGSDGDTPLLAGATITVPTRLLRGWLRTLLRTADSAGTATLGVAPRADADQLRALLEAGLLGDITRIASLAQALAADAGALGAVAALAPVPLLRACADRWAPHVPRAWAHGWCPVC